MAYFWWILDGIAVLYPLAAFYNKKMGFCVQKWKNLKFSKFSTWLTSEALVALLCFLKGRKMFVSREELQMMILSTEWPLCHIGELRYGLSKFFEGKSKILENAFLIFTIFTHPDAFYIHQNGTQSHQFISFENIYHCGSFWGNLTGKNSFWAQN